MRATSTALSENYEIAYFRSVKNLLQHPLKTKYNAVLQEYLTLEHMYEFKDNATTDGGFYLPHHTVSKDSSLTTVLILVPHTSTGVSLNDTLMVNPLFKTSSHSCCGSVITDTCSQATSRRCIDNSRFARKTEHTKEFCGEASAAQSTLTK